MRYLAAVLLLHAGVLWATMVALSLFHSRSLWSIYQAEEDPYALWIAVLKGFDGPVYYVGSNGEFSYFRSGHLWYTGYRAPTAKIHLPHTFPFGQGEPYRVTNHEMVSYY